MSKVRETDEILESSSFQIRRVLKWSSFSSLCRDEGGTLEIRWDLREPDLPRKSSFGAVRGGHGNMIINLVFCFLFNVGLTLGLNSGP